MMHRLDPIRIQMRGNRLHALPLARQQQPGAIAVQPLFLLGMVHRCGERIHVFVELRFFTALTTLCAHALNIETSAAPSARQAMRVSGKLPLSDVCYSRNRMGEKLRLKDVHTKERRTPFTPALTPAPQSRSRAAPFPVYGYCERTGRTRDRAAAFPARCRGAAAARIAGATRSPRWC